MKTKQLHKYVKSNSEYAKKRGYSGYVEAPDGGREWVDSDKQGEKMVREKNETLISMGAKAYSYFTSNPSIMTLIWNIITVLKVMGMTLEEHYVELKAKATHHVLGETLQKYLEYVTERFHSGNGTKAYVETVKFAIKHMPDKFLAMNICQLSAEVIRKEMLTWTRHGGAPLRKSSLLTAQLVCRAALTKIALVEKKDNPFVFEGFKYTPTRLFVTVEQWVTLLDWWYTHELRNLGYFLHRGFLGRRHQELVGKKVYDAVQNKEVMEYTILNGHLKSEDGFTRAAKTKNGSTQFGYWPPAMQAWMKKAPAGDANKSILGVGVNTGKPLSQAAIEALMRQSWRECFGPNVPYIRNWPRHSAATYASAVWGPEIAAKYVGMSVSIMKKHYDGKAEKSEGVRYLSTFPPGYTGSIPCLWAWWKLSDDRERK